MVSRTVKFTVMEQTLGVHIILSGQAYVDYNPASPVNMHDMKGNYYDVVLCDESHELYVRKFVELSGKNKKKDAHGVCTSPEPDTDDGTDYTKLTDQDVIITVSQIEKKHPTTGAITYILQVAAGDKAEPDDPAKILFTWEDLMDPVIVTHFAVKTYNMADTTYEQEWEIEEIP